MPHHLRPATAYAPDILLPGDPARALALAQQLLTEPKMSNHARGLWGYTGETADGRALSIQSTGMGGPSAAIVMHELKELGIERAIRVGTCGALDDALAHGDLIVLGEARSADGTSRTIAAAETTSPNSELTGALAHAADVSPRPGVTADLFYEGDADGERAGWRQLGADVIEMEAATVFALGARLEIATACALVVTDTFEGESRSRIDDETLQDAVRRMGEAAAAALA